MILLLKDDKRTKKVTKRTKKTRTLSMKYWLFHRDPYNGLVESPHHWVVYNPLYDYPQQPEPQFFSWLTFCRKIYSKSSTPADLTYILIHFVLLRLLLRWTSFFFRLRPGPRVQNSQLFFGPSLGSPSIKNQRKPCPESKGHDDTVDGSEIPNHHLGWC